MSEEGYLQQVADFATRAIHVGQEPEKWKSKCAVPGIITSTIFVQNAVGEDHGYHYGRHGNPTRDVLEECLASLDNARHGLCFSSGLGAVTCIFSLLNQGDHLIADNEMYGGTHNLFSAVATRMGIDVSFIKLGDTDKVENTITTKTKMIWVETPTNPTINVVDINKIASLVKKNPKVLLVVDNTFLTSYFQRPLDFGADIVVYSLSKYMNGHSDVIMGAATLNRDDVYQKLKFLQSAMGVVPAPFDCYQVNRGLKTLALRMNQHMKSSMEIAAWLETHPMVEKVLHPGLKSHPGYELSKKQCYGHSGMMSFYIKGELKHSIKFMESLKLITITVSLGGYESLASLPFFTTHSGLSPELLEELGITENLVRFSVGLEDTQCIIDDLSQALIVASKV